MLACVRACVRPCVRPYTRAHNIWLAQLLANDLQREKTVILQCFRKFVDTDFLGQGQGERQQEEDEEEQEQEQEEDDTGGEAVAKGEAVPAAAGDALAEGNGDGNKGEGEGEGEGEDEGEDDTPDYASLRVKELRAELEKRGENPGRDRKAKLVVRLQELDAAAAKA